jgi:hypothetical protein
MVAVYAITASIDVWTTRLGIKTLLLVAVVIGVRAIDRGRTVNTRTQMEGANHE